ncbi:hypothetical protein Q4E93_19850 [Flavitalea sp. BT771]|uniref:hypothetical protein n=1 Tax=Flavitalea sp. BT771 TaxID=3063329 RepID=UPI0026E129B9|nr:hypothetical protein [Flavitalea sp. BT771]MDO6432872.1 hypothetical protein [Flavitalea sp. BT771]MDV6221852.1 hypothetical protein [Flavitalea sp. BT771]
MKDPIIFRSSSTSKVFDFYLANILGLVFIGYLALHLEENPPVVGVVMVLIAFAIGRNSRKICVVMDDRFRILYKRFIPAFSGSREFLFAEISSIEASLPLTQAMETGFISDFLRHRHSFRTSMENTLTIKYHDGHKKQISVNISREDLQEAFRHIQKLSPISIEES